MNISKALLAGAAGFSLVSTLAFAHPHKAAQDSKPKTDSENTHVFELGEDGPVKGTIKIEGFELSLDEFGEEIMTGLKELEGLEGFKQFEGLTGFNLKSSKDKDGKTTFTMKMDKSGLFAQKFGDMEFRFDGSNMDESKELVKKLMRKHKDGNGFSQAKRRAKIRLHADTDRGENTNDARSIIESMLTGGDEDIDAKHMDKDTEIYVFKHGKTPGKKPKGVSLSQGPSLSFEGDKLTIIGDTIVTKDGKIVKVFNDDSDTTMKVDEMVTIENGIRKRRIVIEIESPVIENPADEN